MVGLAVLIVMEVQGNTALQGWRLPTKFPDIFIVRQPTLASIWKSEGVPMDLGGRSRPSRGSRSARRTGSRRRR